MKESREEQHLRNARDVTLNEDRIIYVQYYLSILNAKWFRQN